MQSLLFVSEVIVTDWKMRLTVLPCQRKFIYAALFLCVLAGSGILLARSDDAVQVIAPLPVRTAEVSGEIVGLAAAAERLPLRNPFTLAHERLHEHRGSPVREEKPAVLLASPPVPSSGAPASDTKEAPAPITLRGVVTGADGAQIAILARGTESAALSMGERWYGYEIVRITERSVILHGAAGVVTLIRE